MPDVEKVVKGLECCIKRDPDDKTRCGECPYEGACLNRLKSDALTLLKAQEAVKPIRDINGVYYCGNCDTICVGYEVEFTNSIIKVENYCHKCGRKVKWDG